MAEGKPIYAALMNVQAALKAPKNHPNDFGKYKYRSCEDIVEAAKPLLKENGLFLNMSDEVVQIGDRYYVKATVKVVDIVTGESVQTSALARESAQKKGMDESQITGTASSYARKYALNGLFAIDDTKDADTNEYQETVKQSEEDKSMHEARLRMAAAVMRLSATGEEMQSVCKKKFGKVSSKDLTAAETNQLANHLDEWLAEIR